MANRLLAMFANLPIAIPYSAAFRVSRSFFFPHLRPGWLASVDQSLTYMALYSPIISHTISLSGSMGSIQTFQLCWKLSFLTPFWERLFSVPSRFSSTLFDQCLFTARHSHASTWSTSSYRLSLILLCTERVASSLSSIYFCLHSLLVLCIHWRAISLLSTIFFPVWTMDLNPSPNAVATSRINKCLLRRQIRQILWSVSYRQKRILIMALWTSLSTTSAYTTNTMIFQLFHGLNCTNSTILPRSFTSLYHATVVGFGWRGRSYWTRMLVCGVVLNELKGDG